MKLILTLERESKREENEEYILDDFFGFFDFMFKKNGDICMAKGFFGLERVVNGNFRKYEENYVGYKEIYSILVLGFYKVCSESELSLANEHKSKEFYFPVKDEKINTEPIKDFQTFKAIDLAVEQFLNKSGDLEIESEELDKNGALKKELVAKRIFLNVKGYLIKFKDEKKSYINT